jgi:hypothetical protein
LFIIWLLRDILHTFVHLVYLNQEMI